MNKRIEYIVDGQAGDHLSKQTFEALKETIEQIYKKEQDIIPVIHQLKQNGFTLEKVIINHHQETSYHLFRTTHFSWSLEATVKIIIKDLPAATCRIAIKYAQQIGYHI